MKRAPPKERDPVSSAAVLDFPTVEREAQDAFRASARELAGGLFTAYKLASQTFRANPTPTTWHELKHAHAAWRVAFAAEEEGKRRA